jgi:transcriptional regulator with XRE-family HTH domain
MASPGTRMRNSRVDLRLTLDEVAEKLDKSPQYISALEIGKNRPPAWDLLIDMVELYGVSADYLLGISSAASAESTEQWRRLLSIFERMSPERQNDLVAIANTLNRLDREKTSGQADELDPRLVALYARLEKAGRLDLLADAVNALTAELEGDDTSLGIELGLKPQS